MMNNSYDSSRRFFAVFSGMEMASSSIRFQPSILNPKGIVSPSPRLARLREGLPWVIATTSRNPERVAAELDCDKAHPTRVASNPKNTNVYRYRNTQSHPVKVTPQP